MNEKVSEKNSLDENNRLENLSKEEKNKKIKDIEENLQKYGRGTKYRGSELIKSYQDYLNSKLGKSNNYLQITVDGKLGEKTIKTMNFLKSKEYTSKSAKNSTLKLKTSLRDPETLEGNNITVIGDSWSKGINGANGAMGNLEFYETGAGSNKIIGFCDNAIKQNPKPEFIGVIAGINDLGWKKEEDISKNISKIADKIKEAGITPIVLTIPTGVAKHWKNSSKILAKINRINAYLEKTYGQYLVNTNLALGLDEEQSYLNKEVFGDNLHTNTSGYSRIRQAVIAKSKELKETVSV